jgi:hypothetical protein
MGAHLLTQVKASLVRNMLVTVPCTDGPETCYSGPARPVNPAWADLR